MRKIAPLLFMAAGVVFAQGVSVNTPPPAFTLRNLQRQPRTLSQYKGKVVLINFWASWCGPCLVELPELDRLAAEDHHGQLKVLAISVDSERSDAKQMLTKLGLKHSAFEVLWDRRHEVVRRYNIAVMPTSYILDRRGVVRYLHVGFRPQDPAVWRQEIDSLLRVR